MRGYPYYPRRRSGGKLILILIIVAGFLIYANSQGIIHLKFLDFGNLTSSGTGACVQKVNACGEIIYSKFGANITVLQKSSVQNSDSANQFLSTWKNPSQDGNISGYDVSAYPIVMVATRFDNADGTKTPYVFACKSDGSLEEKTTAGLC